MQPDPFPDGGNEPAPSFFSFRSHLRRLAGIEADKNDFVVAAGIEGEHAQDADNALFDLIAKHGATVIDESEDHRLLLPEIIAELDAAAGFVAEWEIQRHRPVERRLEAHVLQSPWHGRSRRAGVAGDSLSLQSARREKSAEIQTKCRTLFIALFVFLRCWRGPAGKPFSAIIFIASLTGIWATPLDLSIHSSFSLASESS